MIFVILAAAAVLIGFLLWIDHRACRRRMYRAARVIPVDDALAASCERYVVCDEVQDDAGDSAGCSSDVGGSSSAASDRNDS